MAALSVNDFNSRVQALLSNLPTEVQRVNESVAQSIIPIITQRIINQGIDGTGKPFGKYSTTPLPSFFFLNKATGSGADKKVQDLIRQKQKQQGEAYRGISYEEFRRLNNLPTDHVTLSFTGETLADIGVINNQVEGAIVITSIGAKGDKTKAKYNAKGEKVGQNTTEQILDYLGARYGDNILSASEEEQQIIANAQDEELQRILDKYLEG